MRALRTALIFWLPLIAWFLVIHNFSAIPGSDLPRIRIPHAEKIFHFVIYFVLGVLMIRAFDHSVPASVAYAGNARPVRRDDFKAGLAKLAILAIIISACYGGFDELYQRSIPGRTCDIFDFIADCAGSLAGILIYISDTKDRRG